MHPIQQVLMAIFVTTFVNRKIYQSKLSKLEASYKDAYVKDYMEGWTRGFGEGEQEGRKNMWLEHLTDPKAPWYKSTS